MTLSETPRALPRGWGSRQAADSAQWGEEKALPTARRIETGPAISRMLFLLPTLSGSVFLFPVLLLAMLMFRQRNWAEVWAGETILEEHTFTSGGSEVA